MHEWLKKILQVTPPPFPVPTETHLISKAHKHHPPPTTGITSVFNDEGMNNEHEY